VNDFVTDTKKVTCEVPQGSVLGPTLFLLYINDIYNAIPDVKIKLFADDTNVFLFDKDCPCLVLRATECLNSMTCCQQAYP